MMKKMIGLVLAFTLAFAITGCTEQLPKIKAVKDDSLGHFSATMQEFGAKFNSVSEIKMTGYYYEAELYGKAEFDKNKVIPDWEDSRHTDIRIQTNEGGYLTEIKIYSEEERFDLLLRALLNCLDFGEEKEIAEKVNQTIQSAIDGDGHASLRINNIYMFCYARNTTGSSSEIRKEFLFIPAFEN